MNAFEQLKVVIENTRTCSGCHDTVVDALSEIVAESDMLGDGWYSTTDEKLKDFADRDILIEINGKVRNAWVPKVHHMMAKYLNAGGFDDLVGTGKWSVDTMMDANGDFWIIDMAEAEKSAGYK